MAASRICVVTDKSHAVESADAVLPGKALLAGLCKVVTQECENIECALLDIGCAASFEAGIQAEILLREIMSKKTEVVVVRGGPRRWVPQYEQTSLDPGGQSGNVLREGGVYLITGGLGDVGLILAEHLFRTRKARVILTTRHEFPPRDEWGNRPREDAKSGLAKRMHRVQELEAEGAQILVLRADISDPVQLHRVRTEVQQRFGTIHGIFHLAGKAGREAVQLISSIARADSEEHFSAKLDATRSLHEVFGPDNPDFALLFSSNASILGGMGLASYAAANSALDAFVQAMGVPGTTRWISVNWD